MPLYCLCYTELMRIKVEDRHTNIPASYLVLMKDDQILVARRFNTGFEDGKYGLVAGHVDAGETFTEALVREVYEEIGITILPKDARVAHIMHRKGIDSERVDVFFVVTRWEGEVENKEPNKCDDLRWCPIDALPEETIPYVGKALDYIQRGVFYSEEGWGR
jgi:8-oxo-dGTP diphosphatase